MGGEDKRPQQLIEDVRNKAGQHELKHEHWSAMGVDVVRHELEVGDYTLAPKVSVDTKRDITEFAGNLRTDHERFRAECLRAQEAGTLLVVLVENTHGIRNLSDLESWEEPRHEFARRHGKKPYSGRALARQCRTMTERYGVLFDFCAPEEAAQRVVDLLERGEEWIWRKRLSDTQS